jgi:hypothetical protein
LLYESPHANLLASDGSAVNRFYGHDLNVAPMRSIPTGEECLNYAVELHGEHVADYIYTAVGQANMPEEMVAGT